MYQIWIKLTRLFHNFTIKNNHEPIFFIGEKQVKECSKFLIAIKVTEKKAQKNLKINLVY